MAFIYKMLRRTTPGFLLAAGLLVPPGASAQQNRLFSSTLAATGTTAGFFTDAQHHTVQVNVVSPATCSLRLEGSLDGKVWSDLSGAQVCTASTMFHVDGKPVVFVRVSLTAYSGDANGAVVSIFYKGAN